MFQLSAFMFTPAPPSSGTTQQMRDCFCLKCNQLPKARALPGSSRQNRPFLSTLPKVPVSSSRYQKSGKPPFDPPVTKSSSRAAAARAINAQGCLHVSEPSSCCANSPGVWLAWPHLFRININSKMKADCHPLCCSQGPRLGYQSPSETKHLTVMCPTK